MSDIKHLEARITRLEADLACEQRAFKNLMIDVMKVDGPTAPTRSTLLAKAEALEEFENRTERFGAIPYSDLVRRLQVRAYQYRKQAEEEG